MVSVVVIRDESQAVRTGSARTRPAAYGLTSQIAGALEPRQCRLEGRLRRATFPAWTKNTPKKKPSGEPPRLPIG